MFAGCSFAPGAPGNPGGSGGDDQSPDGSTGTIDAHCHVTDPSLRLCLDFEDTPLAPIAHDLAPGKHDAIVAGVTSMPRVTQQAALVGTSSSIHVPETPDLDLGPQLSFEMWLAPTTSAPRGQLAYPLVNLGQYAMSFDEQARVVCEMGLVSVETNSGIATGTTWTHVACTYDGTVAKVYVNGDVDDCTLGFPYVPTQGTSGTAIAESYAGGIDDVHVYAKMLSDSEVCAQAGRMGCQTACPTGGKGGGGPGGG